MEEIQTEALMRLKAEVLAADWRLNSRRARGLIDALGAIETRCRQRQPILLICAMARASLDYLEKRDWQAPPQVLDFLKQVLARLVVLLEDESAAGEKDKAEANRLNGIFLQLKRTLASANG